MVEATYAAIKREGAYVPDKRWKRIPEIAAARNDLARLYRTLRREKPLLGRLMLARYRAALALTKQQIEARWLT
jgi:hypothetical protein